MAAYSFDSDLATDQDLAFGDSAKLVRDGTRLTGNLQSSIARYAAADVYANGDTVTVKLGTLPAGVRIIPQLCGIARTAGGTYTWQVKEAANDNVILSGSATTSTPALFSDFAEQKLTAPTEVILVLTLGAALPASFVAEILLTYAAPA
jgi:hypothetical protein